jgi:glutamyl-tRNA reductase
VLARLQAIPSIDEVILLPTCNRVEASAVADGPAEPVTRAVVDQRAAHGQISAGEVLPMARHRIGGTAVEHFFGRLRARLDGRR